MLLPSSSLDFPVLLNCFPITALVATWWKSCHYSLMLALETWVCSSVRLAQELRDIGGKGQTLTHISSRQITFSSHLSIASSCLHLDKVFWAIRMFLLCCPANEVQHPLIIICITYIKKILCLLLLCLIFFIWEFLPNLA